MSKLIKVLKDAKEAAFTERRYYDSLYDQINKFCLPTGKKFQENNVKGDTLFEQIFDSTGIWSLNQFASGLNAYNTSNSVNWFKFVPKDDELRNDNDLLAILEKGTNRIHKDYRNPKSLFSLSINEDYHEIGAYGTGIIYQSYNEDERVLSLKSYPLASCGIGESSKGVVDEVYRECHFTLKQLIQEFGKDKVPKYILDSKKLTDKIKVIHAAVPLLILDYEEVKAYKNSEGKPMTDKPYISTYFIDEMVRDGDGILRIEGYDIFPYSVGRWSKVSNEILGRSPAQMAIYEVRMLQKINSIIIEAAELNIRPPVAVNVNNLVKSDIDLNSGDIVWVDNVTSSAGDVAKPIFTAGDPRIGDNLIMQVKESIYRAFYVDMMIRQKKKERQTAFEIADERDESLRQMSSNIGMLQNEIYYPTINYSVHLLEQRGEMPELPDGMRWDRDIDIEFTSPAARALKMSNVESVNMVLQATSQMAQFDPTVADIIDVEDALRQFIANVDAPRTIDRSSRYIRAIRESRAEKENMAMQSQMQQQQASASKDLAQAQSIQAQTGY